MVLRPFFKELRFFLTIKMLNLYWKLKKYIKFTSLLKALWTFIKFLISLNLIFSLCKEDELDKLVPKLKFHYFLILICQIIFSSVIIN